MAFDWQTEEEISWDEPPIPTPEPEEPSTPKRRKWPYVVMVILLLLLTAVFVTSRQLKKRIELAEAQAIEEISASVHVIESAAREGDVELLISFLSGQSADWSDGQRKVVDSFNFVNRAGFDLQELADDEELVQEITLSPDLNSAEVQLKRPYAFNIGNGLTETIQLQQTMVYRRGEGKWLLAPPENAFWGERMSSNGRYLTISYPARDAEIAQRLALDLDQKLSEFCTQLSDLSCPENWRMLIDFSPSPHSLMNWAELNTFSIADNALQLPTPTLFGTPTTTQAYERLYLAHARILASSAIFQVTGWNCCDQIHLYNYTKNAQLADLGLLSLRPSDSTELPIDIMELSPLWESDLGDSTFPIEQIEPLFQFLNQSLGRSIGEIQAALIEAESFEEWLQLLGNEQDGSLEEIQFQWLLFVTESTAQASPPQALPEQNLLALCRAGQTDMWSLMFYDLEQDSFQRERSFSQQAAFFGFPNDEQILVTDGRSPFIWDSGETTPLTAIADLHPFHLDPLAEYLVLRDMDQTFNPFRQINLPECLATNRCPTNTLLGNPVWSPDGQRTMMVAETISGSSVGDPLLFIANREGDEAELIGEGHSPYWLNDHEVAFVSIGETIAVLNTISMTATYPFVLSMLAHIVDSDTTAIQSKIVGATNHPALPNSAYFVVQGVYSTGIRFSELYKLDMESFDVEKINELNFERIFAATDGLMWSPNGRYLLRSHFNLDEARWHLAIYDTLTQETLYNTVTAPKEAELQQYLDWSADDGWLVIANQGYLRLVSLETGYEQLVIDEGFKCETAVWVNRTP